MADAGEGDEELVHAYLDGELDVATALTVERKIGADPALQQLAREIGVLKTALAENFPPEPVSPQLRRRIESTLVGGRHRQAPRWALLAATVLLAVALSGPLMMMRFGSGGLDGADAELIDAHLRGLMATQPIDVASSDQHTVKPWFNGRIPRAPSVIDLHEQGFDLVGGRIDVVNDVPMPTLVYRRRQHVISLTETTAIKDPQGSFANQARNGFNIMGWSKGGRSYVAVSDLNAKELGSFTELFRAAL